jgi:hypothetical protein
MNELNTDGPRERARKLGGREAQILAILSALATIVGGLIYVEFRPTTLYVFDWLEWVGIESYRIGSSLPASRHPAFDFFVYSLPNGLWVYAFTLALGAVWTRIELKRTAWLAIPTLVAFTGETGQLVGLVPGTADKLDALAILAAASASYLTLRRHEEILENA